MGMNLCLSDLLCKQIECDLLMNTLGEWMNGILIDWGISNSIADRIDEVLIALLISALAVGLDYVCQFLFVGGMKRYTERSPHFWNTVLVRRKVVHHMIHILPALLVYFLLPWAFVDGKLMLQLSQKAIVLYIVVEILLTLNSILLVVLDLHTARDVEKNRPMKSFIQVLQVLLFFLGGIVFISILLNKSPATLLAGLGASAAVLMLVFKDSILGFVSGIQLSLNDMLRIGDWVQLPGGVVNGVVEEITLNTVKIRNWDKTISTVPPYTLVNSIFTNWRGMKLSGGRRVKKNIYLDMTTLKFCTPELLNRVRQEVPLLADFHVAEESMLTNAQLFRIYIECYLQSLPDVNSQMDLIISQREPTTYGVPIEVYFFTHTTVWKEYERIHSDVFDHLLVMVQKFDLKLYQYSD